MRSNRKKELLSVLELHHIHVFNFINQIFDRKVFFMSDAAF